MLQMDISSIRDLFSFFSSRHYVKVRSDPYVRSIQLFSNQLLSRDFTVTLVDNADGSVCQSYPPSIALLADQV